MEDEKCDADAEDWVCCVLLLAIVSSKLSRRTIPDADDGTSPSEPSGFRPPNDGRRTRRFDVSGSITTTDEDFDSALLFSLRDDNDVAPTRSSLPPDMDDMVILLIVIL